MGIIKKAQAHVTAAGTRGRLLGKVLECTSRNPHNSRWNKLTKAILENFDLGKDALKLIPSDIVEEAARDASARAKDGNFVGVVVGGGGGGMNDGTVLTRQKI